MKGLNKERFKNLTAAVCIGAPVCLCFFLNIIAIKWMDCFAFVIFFGICLK